MSNEFETQPHHRLQSMASKHFQFAQLINCSETAQKHSIDNLPLQQESWFALSQLAAKVLDPIVEQFGPITLTYGFCSSELVTKISKNERPRIAPQLDQHCAHELKKTAQPYCKRLGAACDFYVNDQNINSQQVTQWICENLIFDRIYYYGKNKPLHISYGPELSQFLQLMATNNNQRRYPAKNSSHQQAIELINQVNF